MKNWYLKLRNRVNGYQIAIYPDGTVYGDAKGEKILRLSSLAMEQIRSLVQEDIGMIKKYGYDVQSDGIYNAKFWDDSHHKRSLKVRGWHSAPEVRDIVFSSDNEEERYLDCDYYGLILDNFYEGITE